ncbi:unnamed protein product [Triticum turgidum subsp. durum]|uniref:Small ribosomal subunit protein uS2c n=1 Tax=Triticum turgidum subsp. durum TaxID=4567 RepID=A0A9R0VXM0_TRITD|nr:unnamed protein product [Triticum turgidum subsp. durum]
MAPYISAKRKGTHIINLARTARFLSEACDLVFDAASQGKSFLIVGTKKRATDLVASAAIRAHCHYVNKKWFSGMLTNWRLPDFVIVLDQQKEYIALRECAILGIPTISLVDTNSDPDLANISIPANDDTMISIRLILTKLVFSICEGRSL